MNRFEIIFERIAVLSKDRSKKELMTSIEGGVQHLVYAIKDMHEDNDIEKEYIKKRLCLVLFDMLALASMQDQCGACICSNLEEEIRLLSDKNEYIIEEPAVANAEISIPQPSVHNETNPAVYTLICDKCGKTFESSVAFPDPQICPTCYH
jgi:hypothetical protein